MKRKTQANKASRNYTKVPNKVFKMGLSIEEIGIYHFCLSLPETFNPSIRFIAKQFHIGTDKVRKHLKTLESRGMIKRYFKGNVKIANKYELLPPKEWKYESKALPTDSKEAESETQVEERLQESEKTHINEKD